MNTVEWRSVVGFEGYYEVSSDGMVRSIDRVVQNHGKPMRRRACEMKQRLVKGYQMVCLRKDGAAYYRAVHRLVAGAFPRGDGDQVRHLDGNRVNNRAENLMWGTLAENVADRERHGTTVKGERHSRARHSAAFVSLMRHLYSVGRKTAHIGKRLRLPRARVHEIVKHRSWGHV